MQSNCKYSAWLVALLVCGSLLPRRTVGQDAPAPQPAAPVPVADPGAAAGGAAPAPTAPSAATELKPPRVLESAPPVYPSTHLKHGEHPTVVLKLTVMPDGQVADVTVEHTAGADFDQAAVAAVKRWTFAPAQRGPEAIASRVGVAVHFELPELSVIDVASVADAQVMVPHPHAEPIPAHGPSQASFGATAKTKLDPLRPEARGASSFAVERRILEAAPRKEGADMLSTVPGIYIARGEGDAVAHGIMIRGFDAEHGQDLELRLGGLPLNLPSHLHGQGYADLGSLIPEVVEGLRVTEGVYDPRQGDFAVAGSVDIDLAVERRGALAKSSYGSFGTFRQLALWAPEGMSPQTFGAVQYARSQGFGQNRRSASASAILQHSTRGGPWRYRALAIVYGAGANLAGVVRRDDVSAGRIGFYDVYPYPTAQKQNASASRVLVGGAAEYRGKAGESGELGLWLGLDRFRLQENFTGFTQRSATLPNVTGRGDLIEQINDTFSLGLWGHYRTGEVRPLGDLHGHLEMGTSGRMDDIEQAQNLLDASVRSQTWDRRVDAHVRALDVGLWADVAANWSHWATLRAGVRADLLQYGVDDRLGNFANVSRPKDTYIVGFRRSAMGAAFGPRTSAEFRPWKGLALRAAYGEGYRSPQARTLEDGERAPFTKVRSADLGVTLAADRLFSVGLTGYLTRLSDDAAFDAREGRLERVGASRRMGGLLHGTLQPMPWLVGAASITYVNAELLEPPQATPARPQPAFRKGQSLPYVPPVVVRLDLGVQGTLLALPSRGDLTGRAGVGYSYLSPRPLPYSARAAQVSLIDLSAELGFSPMTLGLSVFNLLDTQYAAVEHSFTSDWDPGPSRSRVPARHVAAGAPRTILATWGIHL